MDEDSNEVYVIMRVENTVSLNMCRLTRVFVDPLRCLANGSLTISGLSLQY